MRTFEFNNDIQIPKEVEERFEEVAKIIAATSTDVRTVAITSTSDEEGKTFVGWALSASSQETFKSLPAGTMGDVTLYAVFTDAK